MHSDSQKRLRQLLTVLEREKGRDCLKQNDKFYELRIKNYSILLNLDINQPLFHIAYLFPEVISQSDCLNIDARQKKEWKVVYFIQDD